jgi:hypothetical protein
MLLSKNESVRIMMHKSKLLIMIYTKRKKELMIYQNLLMLKNLSLDEQMKL